MRKNSNISRQILKLSQTQNNCEIARTLGISESLVRYYLNKAETKKKELENLVEKVEKITALPPARTIPTDEPIHIDDTRKKTLKILDEVTLQAYNNGDIKAAVSGSKALLDGLSALEESNKNPDNIRYQRIVEICWMDPGTGKPYQIDHLTTGKTEYFPQNVELTPGLIQAIEIYKAGKENALPDTHVESCQKSEIQAPLDRPCTCKFPDMTLNQKHSGDRCLTCGGIIS